LFPPKKSMLQHGPQYATKLTKKRGLRVQPCRFEPTLQMGVDGSQFTVRAEPGWSVPIGRRVHRLRPFVSHARRRGPSNQVCNPLGSGALVTPQPSRLSFAARSFGSLSNAATTPSPPFCPDCLRAERAGRSEDLGKGKIPLAFEANRSDKDYELDRSPLRAADSLLFQPTTRVRKIA
jgi:hypothetical protein